MGRNTERGWRAEHSPSLFARLSSKIAGLVLSIFLLIYILFRTFLIV